MDLEPHSYSDETAANLMRAARVGTSDIVARPAKGEFMRMSRLLEAGATGILYPRCSNAEEAREIVKWAKFAPQGKRGFDGSSGDNPYRFMDAREYIETANNETFIIAQLEEQSAIDQAEEICARLILQGSDLMGLKGLLQKLKEDAAPLGFTFND